MTLDRYEQFKIACIINGTSLAEQARKWGVTAQHVKAVAEEPQRSKRIDRNITEAIKRADEKFTGFNASRKKATVKA